MRSARQALSTQQRQLAAQRLTQHLSQHLCFRQARHIGSYLAHGGEIDTLPSLVKNWQRQTRLYLPVIAEHPTTHMKMIGWIPGQRLLTNHFGIREPDPRRHQGRPIWAMDILLIPLVAFDAQGNRLGMGGGYYDRLLADLATRPRRPKLVGVAYHFQQVERLPTEPWDQRLDYIVSDKG